MSLIINIGILGIFKYYNFFIGSFAEGLSYLNIQVNPWTLDVILPVGISFYTFHGLSYIIDVYKGRIREEKDFVSYAVFVSFFPLLVAGPIERATHLLPQIKNRRTFDFQKATDGLRQILWGLFKKVVIADQCAEYVNLIFSNSTAYSGSTLLVGAILFACQIYGDFSGYSDIALGVARLFGIELVQNFAYPLFSRDMAEFWRRWHISLSTWFRDYIFIPLELKRGGTKLRIVHIFLIFVLSGIWHGANWTFIVWGFLNALLVLPFFIFKSKQRSTVIVAQGKALPSVKELCQMVFTLLLIILSGVFFRAESVSQAIGILGNIFSSSFLTIPSIRPKYTIIYVIIFICIEWAGRENSFAIANFKFYKSSVLGWSFYYTIACAVLYFSGQEQQFIYFQF